MDIVRARQSQSRNDVFYLIVQWGGVRCLDLTLVKSNGSGRQELCVCVWGGGGGGGGRGGGGGVNFGEQEAVNRFEHVESVVGLFFFFFFF